MKHLGDICKINGALIPLADVIVGGSPCQDLSVAGNRKGMKQTCPDCGAEYDVSDMWIVCPVCGGPLEKTRSGLFMEQIRIVREQRNESIKRADNPIRPRFMVWENVPGAFSSNKAEDFRVVLEETARVADSNAVIPRPPKNKWANAGAIMGNGFSIAWRVQDAQFWGVPQRRRRIALVADFGGITAPEILFERKGVSGDIAESGAERQGIAGDAERGVKEASLFTPCNFGKEGQGYRENKITNTLDAVQGSKQTQLICFAQNQRDEVRDLHDVAGSLAAEPGMKQQTYVLQGSMIGRADKNGPQGDGINEDVCFTLNTTDRHSVAYGICSYESNSMKSANPHSGIYEADTSRTLDLNGGNPACNQGGIAVVARMSAFGQYETDGTFSAMKQRGYKDATDLVLSIDRAAFNQGENAQYDFQIDDDGISQTVISRGPNAIAASNNNYAVRRLTPLECSRLQGYPDNWAHIPEIPQTEQNISFFQNVWNEWNDINEKPHKTRNALLKWMRTPSSDSAEYKSYGNSIALPPWRFVLSRIYQHGARTLGSLFDGIGGFPLIWSELPGTTTAWASEIEPFPIAVTTIRLSKQEV